MRKTTKKSFAKRFLALVLTAAMTVTGLPQTLFAAELPEEAVPETQEAVVSPGDAVWGDPAADINGVTDTDEGSGPVVIKVDMSSVGETYSGYGVRYDSVADTFFKTYAANAENVFKNFVEGFVENKVYIMGDDVTGLYAHLEYQWYRRGADGQYTSMNTELPAAVGAYKLVISLPESLVEAEPAELLFEVRKSKISFGLGSADLVFANRTKVADLKADLREKLVIYENGIESDRVYAETLLQNLNISVKKAGAADTAKLGDTEELLYAEDYTVCVSAEAADADGYEVEALYRNLRFDAFKTAVLDVVYPGSFFGVIRTYTGQAVAAPVKGTEYTFTLTETVDGEKKEIPYSESEISMKWYDVNGWYMDPEHSTEMKSAPVSVGTYYYVIRYTDSRQVYESTYKTIKVIVEEADVNLKPSLDATKKFYAGMTARDVYMSADYAVYKADGNKLEINRDTFFGVTYDDRNQPQSYVPVFVIQKQLTDRKGTTGEWVTIPGDEALVATDTEDENGVKTAYRLISNGQKAIRRDGTGSVDILATGTNSAEKNYKIDTSLAEENAIAVTVLASANAVIDVTALLIDQKGDSTANIYQKIYDGKALYKDRSEYKKAVVKSGESTVCKGTSPDLVYQWYEVELSEQPALDESGNVRTDEDGKVITELVVSDSDKMSTGYDYLPKDAGTYMLQISYNDPAKVYFAKDAYVYYEIEPQLVRVDFDGSFTVYSETPVNGDDLAETTEDFTYGVYLVPDNDPSKLPTGAGKETYRLNWNYDLFDYAYFYVERVADLTAAKKEYVNAEDENYLLSGEYRLSLAAWPEDIDELNGNYINYMIVDDQPVYVNDPKPITVKKIGDVPIRIEVDAEVLKSFGTEKIYDGKGFDITDALANGLIRVVNLQSGEYVPVTGENAISLSFRWEGYDGYRYDDGNDEYVRAYTTRYSKVSSKNSGTYGLYVRFAGDDTYQPYNYGKVSNFTISKRELAVSPGFVQRIYAGETPVEGHLLAEDKKISVTGYLAKDASYFNIYGSNGLPVAFDSIRNIKVYKNGAAYASYMRTGDVYRLNLDLNWNEEYYYDRSYELFNYELVCDTVEFKTNARRLSDVSSEDCEITVGKDESTLTQTVKPAIAVDYYYADDYLADIDGTPLIGNYLIFEIGMPYEFYNGVGGSVPYSMRRNFAYANSIAKAGGYVLYEGTTSIQVAFDAAQKKEYSFSILWEEGFEEHFKVDCTKAELYGDLGLAVTPKSMKFNGVNTKMVVGESQQLDVALKKQYSRDVVELRYALVSGENVLSVTELGFVTATGTGTASVEVYPVRRTGEGALERLPFKPVVAKIQVSDVATVKIKSVVASDTGAGVSYPLPANGYRRELYVLPGKNLAPDVFEEKIAAAGKGAASGFVTTSYPLGEGTIVKNLVWEYFYGLEPDTDYTVYVRNVSGIRTTDSGAQVPLSVGRLKGATKTFRTAKTRMESIRLRPDCDEWFSRPMSMERSGKQPVSPDPNITYNEEKDRFEIPLSAKSTVLITEGQYRRRPVNEAADDADTMWIRLPLTSDIADKYQPAKLSYYALDLSKPIYDATGNVKKPSGYIELLDMYVAVSKIAAIDKKGKVSLKGTGEVAFAVLDKDSGKFDATELYITSDVTGLTAKKVKMSVAQSVNVYELLTYMSNGKKLKTDKENIEALYPVELQIVGDGIVDNGDGTITAVKTGTDTTVKVFLADRPEIQTTMDITISPIADVKGVKATDLYDTEALISFNSVLEPDNDFKFRVDVKDARGNVVFSDIEDSADLHADVWPGMDSGWPEPPQKSHKYEILVTNLIRLSAYTVSITPVYGAENEETGKTVTAKFKTTNVPASHVNNLDDKILLPQGGEKIELINTEGTNYRLSSLGYLTSGNTYSIRLITGTIDDGICADKITWASSDSKVATVKAGGGDFTAKLVTKKQGFTYITATSKITKHVIARWGVEVKAVGNAETAFPDYDFFDRRFDITALQSEIAVLTEQNPVSSAPYVSFTAPEYGSYRFNGVASSYATVQSDGYGTWFNLPTAGLVLEKGQKIYLKRTATARVTGTYYETIVFGEEITPATDKTAVFVAPADGYYVRYTLADGVRTYRTADPEYLTAGRRRTYPLTAGTTYVFERCAEISPQGTAVNGLAGNDREYLAYFAALQGDYAFDYVTEGNITFSYKVNDNAWTTWTKGAADEALTLSLKAGDRVCFRVRNDGAEQTDVTLKVTEPVIDELTVGTAKTFAVAKGKAVYLKLPVEDTKTTYIVTAKAQTEEGTPAPDVVLDYYHQNGSQLGSMKNSTTLTVSKPSEILFKVSVDSDKDSETVEMLVEKITAKTLTAGTPQPLSTVDGVTEYFTFKAPSYGRYEFRTVTTNGAATFYYSAARVNALNDLKTPGGGWGTSPYWYGDVYTSLLLTQGQEITIFVRSNGTAVTEGENKTSAVLRADKILATELANGTKLTAPVDYPGATSYYRFTAPADGSYNVTVEKDANVEVSGQNSLTGNGWATTIPTITLDKGEFYYFKAVNKDAKVSETEGAEAGHFKITVSDAAHDELPDAEIPVTTTDGLDKTYTYTFKETARYALSVTASDAEKISATVSVDGSVAADGREYVKRLGDTVTVRVQAAATEDGNVKVAFRKVEAAEWPSETVTVKAGTTAWYKLEIPENGRYLFEAQDVTDENDQQNLNPDLYEELTKTTRDARLNNLNEAWLTKDYTRYVMFRNSGSTDQKIRISMEKIRGEELTLGEDKAISLENNETKWYRYTVQEEGYLSLLEDSGGKLNTYYYSGTDDTSNNFADVISVIKGDVLLVKVQNTSGAKVDAKLSLKNANVRRITVGAKETVTFTKGETKYIEFIRPSESSVEMYCMEIPEQVTLTSWGVAIDSQGYAKIAAGDQGDRYLFTLTANWDEAQYTEETAAIKLYTCTYRVETLEDELEVDLKKGVKFYYTYTVLEDGWYYFPIDKGTAVTEVISEDVTALSQGKAEFYSKGAAVNNTIYFKGDSEPEELRVKISAKKVVPEAYADGTVTLEGDISKWYEFAPGETGVYQMSSSSIDCILEYYTSMQSSKKYASGWKNVTLALEKSDKIYFRVRNLRSGTKTAELTMAEVPVETISAGTPRKFTTTEEDTVKYFRYPMEEDKYYQVTASRTGTATGWGRNLTIYRGLDTNKLSTEWGSRTTITDDGITGIAGKDMIIALQTVDAGDYTVELKAIREVKDTFDIMVNDSAYRMYAFTAEKAGNYVFVLRSPESQAYLYYGIREVVPNVEALGSYKSSKGLYGEDVERRHLAEGEKVYVRLFNPGAETDDPYPITFNVLLDLAQEMFSADVPDADGAILSYTAAVSGAYTFTNRSNAASAVAYCGQDETGEKTIESLTQGNSKTVYLAKGTTVYFKAKAAKTPDYAIVGVEASELSDSLGLKAKVSSRQNAEMIPYRVPKTGSYTFRVIGSSYEENDDDAIVYYYGEDSGENAEFLGFAKRGNTIDAGTLEAGATVYFKTTTSRCDDYGVQDVLLSVTITE